MAGYGQRTGIISSFTDLGVPDEPDVRGKLVPFDPQVFKRTKGLLTDWTQNRNQYKSLFNEWLGKFNAATPEYDAAIHRENDYLKYLQDGGFEKTLAGIRAGEHAADEAEKSTAMDFARGASDRFKFASGGSTGRTSGDYLRDLNVGRRIGAEFAGRDMARTRSDLNWANTMKASAMGRIQANLDRMVNRTMTPQQLSDSELMSMIQSLGGISQVRLGSAAPVFWREKGSMEKVGDTLDTFADSAYKGANAFSTFGGMGGGMGGMGGGGAPSGAQSGGVSAEMAGGGNFPGGMPRQQGAPSAATAPAPQQSYSAGQDWLNRGGSMPSWTDAF